MTDLLALFSPTFLLYMFTRVPREEDNPMKLKTLVLAGSLTLSVPVHAAELFTPTLWAVAPDALACNLTNVGQKTRTVRVRIISNGAILLDSGQVKLDPQHTTDHTVAGPPEGSPIYCQFTVEGPKRRYRGVAKLFHAPNSNDFVAVPAE
jgi:hypothetical protein